MNSRQRGTLEALQARPVRRDIEWRRIESLLLALGCELIERRGSRVAFQMRDLRADFHRPHPGNAAKPYQVRAVCEFLQQLEILP